MIKPTQPLQYVCLFQADIATAEDGDVFSYLAVDMFSNKAFFTGSEKSRANNLIIKHTKLLIEDADFKTGLERYKSFTLVYHRFEDIIPEINSILKPYNGNAIVNDALITKVALPVVKKLFEALYKK